MHEASSLKRIIDDYGGGSGGGWSKESRAVCIALRATSQATMALYSRERIARCGGELMTLVI
jgi:hypothetical protein